MPAKKNRVTPIQSYAKSCEHHLDKLGPPSKYSYSCNYYINNDGSQIAKYSAFQATIFNGDLADFKFLLRNGADLSIKTLDSKDIFQLCNPLENNGKETIDFELAAKRFEIFKILAQNIALIKSYTKFQTQHSLDKNPQYRDYLLDPVTVELEASFNQTKTEFFKLASDQKIAVPVLDVTELNIEPIELNEWQQKILLSGYSPYFEYLATFKKASEIEIDLRARMERGSRLPLQKTAKLTINDSEIFNSIIIGNISDAAYLMSISANPKGYLEKTAIQQKFDDFVNAYFKHLNAYEIFTGSAKINDLNVSQYYPPDHQHNIFNIMLFLKDYNAINNSLSFVLQLNALENDGENVFEKLIYGVENFNPQDDLRFASISFLIYYGAIYNFNKSLEESQKLKTIILEFASTQSSQRFLIEKFFAILEPFTQELKTNFLTPAKLTPSPEIIDKIENFLDFYLELKLQSNPIKTLPFIADTSLIKNHYLNHLKQIESEKFDFEVCEILNFVGFMRYLCDFKVIEYFRYHEKNPIIKTKILNKIDQLIDCLAENCDIYQDQQNYCEKLREEVAKQNAQDLLDSLKKTITPKPKKPEPIKPAPSPQTTSKFETSSQPIKPTTSPQTTSKLEISSQPIPKTIPSLPKESKEVDIFKKIDEAATQTQFTQIHSSTQTSKTKTQDLSTQTLVEPKKFTVVNLNIYHELISSIIPQSNIEEFDKKFDYINNQALLFCVDMYNFYPLNYAFVFSNFNFFKKIFSCHEALDQSNSPISATNIFQSHDSLMKNSLMYLISNSMQTSAEKLTKLRFLFSKLSPQQAASLVNQKTLEQNSLIDLTLNQQDDDLSLFLIQNNHVNLALNDERNSILIKIFRSNNHEFLTKLVKAGAIDCSLIDQKIIDFLFQENFKIASCPDNKIDQSQIKKNSQYINYLKRIRIPRKTFLASAHR